jgi:hypothetical protein
VPNTRRSPVIVGLLVLLALEFVAIAVVAVVLVVDLFVADATSVASGVALAILCIVAAIWMGAMIVGLLRAQPWVRSGVIVWQFLQVAIAIGAFQGVFRVPAVGWVLLVPAVIGLVLVLSRPATRLLARHEAE